MLNVLPSEAAALAATIDPDAYAASDTTPQTSDWVDASRFETLLAVVMTGTLPATVTVSAKLEQATSDAGAGAKDIAGKAITPLAAVADSDKQALINLRGEELDVDGGFRYVRLSVTIADSASPDAASADLAAFVFGHHPRYGPASDYDLASVAEIVT